MKYLGIDYGTKRIGIAVSDEGGEFAFPKGIISPQEAVVFIAGLCVQESIGGIVMGKSVASNGVDNALSAPADHFREKIEGVTGLLVYLQDEGYSTVEAHRYQTEAGSRDDSAAAIILQRFLDSHKVQ